MPRKSTGPSWVNAKSRVAKLLDEIAIVGDHEGRALVAVERVAERDDRLEVEVVGRLVEHQHVVLGQHQLREEEAHRLAAGERGGRLLPLFALEEHLAEQAADVLR